MSNSRMAHLAKSWRCCVAVGCLGMVISAGAAEVGVADDSIKIGIVGPFTGVLTQNGGTYVGIQAYIKSVNADGGVNGRRIELIVDDGGCDPSKSIAAVRRVVSAEQVFALMGPSCSAAALAVKKFMVDSGTPWILPEATDADIYTPTVPTIYQVGILPNSVSGDSIIDFVMSKPGTKRVAFISHPDKWGTDSLEPEIGRLKDKYDIEPVAVVDLAQGATSATTQVLRL